MPTDRRQAKVPLPVFWLQFCSAGALHEKPAETVTLIFTIYVIYEWNYQNALFLYIRFGFSFYDLVFEV